MYTLCRRIRLSPAAHTFLPCAERRSVPRSSGTTWKVDHHKERTRCLSIDSIRLLKASQSAQAQGSSASSDESPMRTHRPSLQTPTTIPQRDHAPDASQIATKSMDNNSATLIDENAGKGHAAISPVSREFDCPQQLTNIDLDKLNSWRQISYLRPTGLDVLDSIWKSFEQMLAKQRIHLLSDPGAESLRDDILVAALSNRERTMRLMQALELVEKEHHFEWPDLYLKAMSRLLERQDYELATQVHFLLNRVLPPENGALGTLLSTFITDPSPRVQSLLAQLYLLSTDRNAYDHVIPSLFFSGQSMAARDWRKQLIAFEDFPSKSNMSSRPFLRFLSLYFPSIQLTPQELEILRNPIQPSEAEKPDNKWEPIPILSASFLSDATVARWFASRWTSIEFAINILGRSGVRKIGPLALQSLALREDDATGVRTRLAQLQKLDVQVAENVYSKSVIAFARNGDQKNLDTILECDVHPDEFEKPRVREMVRIVARKKSDKKMQELFETIEDTLRLGQLSESRSRPGNAQNRGISTEINHSLRPTDLMQQSARYQDAVLLAESFRGLKRHIDPKLGPSGRQRQKELADRAINTTRQLVDNEVTIPLLYWRTLLYHLGRYERFSEVEQLCIEIVDLYRPNHGGIMEVHPHDVPKSKEPSEGDERPEHGGAVAESTHRRTYEDFSSIFFSVSETGYPQKPQRRLYVPTSLDKESAWIPTDLPFGHHKHPLYILFSRKFQRNVVEWGFSCIMRAAPVPGLSSRGSPTLATHDMAWGVRILALLRDKGVLIDQMSLKTSVYKSTVALQMPTGTKDRSRDSNETSPAIIKRMVEDAWGSELLPPLVEFQNEVDRRMHKLWDRKRRLANAPGQSSQVAFGEDNDFMDGKHSMETRISSKANTQEIPYFV